MAKSPCVVCGTRINLEAHHPDHSKPLEVIWLCRFHHNEVTRGRLDLETGRVSQYRLTHLERQVLGLVLEGKSNKQIASELIEDEACIKTRIRAAFRKLGIRSTRELLPIADKTKELLHLVP